MKQNESQARSCCNGVKKQKLIIKGLDGRKCVTMERQARTNTVHNDIMSTPITVSLQDHTKEYFWIV